MLLLLLLDGVDDDDDDDDVDGSMEFFSSIVAIDGFDFWVVEAALSPNPFPAAKREVVGLVVHGNDTTVDCLCSTVLLGEK